MTDRSSMEVRVSYIVITRNRLEQIRQALPMWKGLKGPQDELIVVDGASTDGSYELLLGAEPGLIDTLIHEKDRSEAHADNKGILAARGKYIKIIADDDVFYREPLEQAYAVMEANPDIDLLMCGGESIDQIKDQGNLKPFFYQWYPDGTDMAGRHEYVTMNGQGMVLRRSAVPVTGLFDPRHLHCDTSFLTQATVRGARMAYLRVKVYSHRVGAQSNSLMNVRKTYIYRAFGFKGMTRWRYIKRPGEAIRWLLERAGVLNTVPDHEPVWDGKLLY
jgi:glycosyltransferase involved in cell wall biosynthesis